MNTLPTELIGLILSGLPRGYHQILRNVCTDLHTRLRIAPLYVDWLFTSRGLLDWALSSGFVPSIYIAWELRQCELYDVVGYADVDPLERMLCDDTAALIVKTYKRTFDADADDCGAPSVDDILYDSPVGPRMIELVVAALYTGEYDIARWVYDTTRYRLGDSVVVAVVLGNNKESVKWLCHNGHKIAATLQCSALDEGLYSIVDYIIVHDGKVNCAVLQHAFESDIVSIVGRAIEFEQITPDMALMRAAMWKASGTMEHLVRVHGCVVTEEVFDLLLAPHLGAYSIEQVATTHLHRVAHIFAPQMRDRLFQIVADQTAHMYTDRSGRYRGSVMLSRWNVSAVDVFEWFWQNRGMLPSVEFLLSRYTYDSAHGGCAVLDWGRAHGIQFGLQDITEPYRVEGIVIWLYQNAGLTAEMCHMWLVEEYHCGVIDALWAAGMRFTGAQLRAMKRAATSQPRGKRMIDCLRKY